MKKYISILILLCLLLTGCGNSERPSQWADGWTEIAPFLAAEPMDGYTFQESADVFGLGGVYYATWTRGDPRDYTNGQGEETVIFDSQIYVIAQEFRSESEANTALAQWKAREQQSYECGEAYSLNVNSMDFTILPLLSGSETNPYGFGCAAFIIRGTNAICVELVCTDTFTADQELASELSKRLRSEYGVNVRAYPDVVSAESTYEILIGNTNRAFSAELTSALESNSAEFSWAFAYSYGKLAFVANSPEAFDYAKDRIFGFMLATGRDFVTAFTLVAATFIPIDLIKCTAAALLALPVNRALERGSIEN